MICYVWKGIFQGTFKVQASFQLEKKNKTGGRVEPILIFRRQKRLRSIHHWRHKFFDLLHPFVILVMQLNSQITILVFPFEMMSFYGCPRKMNSFIRAYEVDYFMTHCKVIWCYISDCILNLTLFTQDY